MLIAQDEILVERYLRRGVEWLFTVFSDLDNALRLESIGCAVPLRVIYERVFPAEASARVAP